MFFISRLYLSLGINLFGDQIKIQKIQKIISLTDDSKSPQTMTSLSFMSIPDHLPCRSISPISVYDRSPTGAPRSFGCPAGTGRRGRRRERGRGRRRLGAGRGRGRERRRGRPVLAAGPSAVGPSEGRLGPIAFEPWF